MLSLSALLCALPLFSAGAADGAMIAVGRGAWFHQRANAAVPVVQQQQWVKDDEKELRQQQKRQLVMPSIPASIEASILSLAVEEAPAGSPTAPVASLSILSYFTPSPSAPPTPVTQQSQIETTWIPQYTTCRDGQTGPPYLNVTPTNAAMSDPAACETFYSPALTTLCATTLTGVATKVTVSRCSQDVTFSSDFGTAMVTLTPASPTLQLRTTYYLAPWQSLTAGAGVLPSDVDVKVCHARPGGNDTMEDCIRVAETWAVLPVTLTSTFTSSVDVLATLTDGPGRYVVGTVHGVFVANKTVVSLSTEMVMNYAYEAETISRGARMTPTPTEGVGALGFVSAVALSTVSSTSTWTRTRTVQVATGDDTTTTLTDVSTSTLFTGTSTMYMDTPRIAMDAASASIPPSSAGLAVSPLLMGTPHSVQFAVSPSAADSDGPAPSSLSVSGLAVSPLLMGTPHSVQFAVSPSAADSDGSAPSSLSISGLAVSPLLMGTPHSVQFAASPSAERVDVASYPSTTTDFASVPLILGTPPPLLAAAASVSARWSNSTMFR